MNYKFFQAGWWGQAILLVPGEHWTPSFLIHLNVLFPDLNNFSTYMCEQVLCWVLKGDLLLIYRVFFCPILCPAHFSHLGFHRLLASSSQLRERTLPGSPFLWQGPKLLKPVICNSHGAGLAHLLLLGDHCPALSDVQCLEIHRYTYVVCFWFCCCFRWEGESDICFPTMTRSRSLF